MAKKKSESSESFGSIFDLVKSFDDSAEIIANSSYSNIKEWIPSGNYMLNACMSGDLFKAVPAGRTVLLVGESGVGKTYLHCSICREAQKLGYTPIMLDSEGSIDSTFVSRLGVDPNNCIIKQVNTISECSMFIANLCKKLEEQQEKTGDHQKVILILDSVGNLTSDKEKEDILSGNQKRDFTKQTELKALFRVNQTNLSKLGIPFIATSHVYASMNMFSPGNEISGGSGLKYNASITLELFASKLDDKENDEASNKNLAKSQVKNGVNVTAKPKKSRFCIPNKVRFQIPFFKMPNPYVGLDEYINWENGGICRGNVLDEKAFSKLPPSEQMKCHPFEFNGAKLYCQPKDTARGFVVKHLGRQVSVVELFSDVVFTPEYLQYVNEHIIHPIFQLPDNNSFDDIKEIEESLGINSEEPEEGGNTQLNP